VELGNRRRRPTVLIRVSDRRDLPVPLRHSPRNGRKGCRSLTVGYSTSRHPTRAPSDRSLASCAADGPLVRRPSQCAQRTDRPRPAAIASCHGIADVADAVQVARALGQEVSVRGGGQNVAGLATIGAQARDAAAWTRDDRPRRWKPGNRWPDTRRRTWLADTQVRSRARQPASRRDRRRGNASDFPF
jgi:hypothetical protein